MRRYRTYMARVGHETSQRSCGEGPVMMVFQRPEPLTHEADGTKKSLLCDAVRLHCLQEELREAGEMKDQEGPFCLFSFFCLCVCLFSFGLV